MAHLKRAWSLIRENLVVRGRQKKELSSPRSRVTKMLVIHHQGGWDAG